MGVEDVAVQHITSICRIVSWEQNVHFVSRRKIKRSFRKKFSVVYSTREKSLSIDLTPDIGE